MFPKKGGAKEAIYFLHVMLYLPIELFWNTKDLIFNWSYVKNVGIVAKLSYDQLPLAIPLRLFENSVRKSIRKNDILNIDDYPVFFKENGLKYGL